MWRQTEQGSINVIVFLVVYLADLLHYIDHIGLNIDSGARRIEGHARHRQPHRVDLNGAGGKRGNRKLCELNIARRIQRGVGRIIDPRCRFGVYVRKLGKPPMGSIC